jgi:acetyl-CoA synthetase
MSAISINTPEEYQKAYKKSIEQPEQFWEEIASELLWQKRWDKVLEWNFAEPSVKWFIGGRMNITENCLDRHLSQRGNQTAIIWEPNDPRDKARKITYSELYSQVCHFSNVLLRNGVRKGDRVCIYMPMIPELTIAVLACARIGAIHSVVFAGFSAQSVADRINDSQCSLVITADGLRRGARQSGVKTVVDEALKQCQSVHRVIVFNHLGWEPNMVSRSDGC